MRGAGRCAVCSHVPLWRLGHDRHIHCMNRRALHVGMGGGGGANMRHGLLSTTPIGIFLQDAATLSCLMKKKGSTTKLPALFGKVVEIYRADRIQYRNSPADVAGMRPPHDCPGSRVKRRKKSPRKSPRRGRCEAARRRSPLAASPLL